MTGPVQTAPEKIENAALFLRLARLVTRVHHENGAFRERSSNQRNLRCRPCVLVCTENVALKTELFRKHCYRDTHVISLPEFSSNPDHN